MDPTPASGTATSALERLLDAIEAHAASEQGAIVAYHTMAADFANPVLAQIIKLIADDEERHHRVFRQMARMIQGNLAEWPAAAMPPIRSGLAPADRDAAIGILQTALRDERKGTRELRALAREHGDRYEGLLALLFELLALDSQKHARMLQFVLRQLQAERRDGSGDSAG